MDGLMRCLTAFALVVTVGCSAPTSSPSSSPSPALTVLDARHVTSTSTSSVGSCHSGGVLPDPRCTPGSLNPQVTQATTGTTICKTGWTSTIRPPTSVTGLLKTTVAKAYRISPFVASNYEGDHFIPLELGGNPETTGKDATNFWDEPRTVTGPDGKPAGFPVKDRFENYERQQVCAGRLTLAEAQRRMSTDWYSAYVSAGRP